MGLSSKQVSSDEHGWSQTLVQAQTLELPKPASMKPPLQPSQNQQQLGEPLKCPRCDSTNTKFCYYNNYNKSQPRHFCKTCKRHWTKGGTLRNVPVGGGRKNKRLKTSNTAVTSTATAATACRVSPHMAPFTLGDQKNLRDILYQPSNNIGSLISSSLVLPQNQSLNIPYASTVNSFNATPCSISTSFQLSNVVNYAGETIEDPAAGNIINSTSMPITSSSTGMDNMTSYWNWDDIDTLVSTDLNIPWDDSDIKP